MLRRNILIFHNAALGDFIVTWPLAMACGRLFPQSRVIYVTAGQKGKLAEHVLGVESVDIETGWSGLWADPAALAPAAKRMIEGAQAIFSFVASDSARWDVNVKALAPQSPVIHLNTKPEGSDLHAARAVASQVQAFHPAVAAGVEQMIDSLSRRGFSSRPGQRQGVLIHPGSGAERKNWPRERFLQLATRLTAAGRAVRVVLGEVEIEKWGRAACDAFADVATIHQPQSLVELSRWCAEAEVVVCNDSGPGHLSGIIGAPTISLFGPTSDVQRWRPLGPAVRIVTSAESMDSISVEQVEQEILTVLAAKPG